MLTIRKASAGSGKTYRLAETYIRLLLSHPTPGGGRRLNMNPRSAHRAILAITFTNKATEEMKMRIIHQLAVLAAMEPGWQKESPYAGDFLKEFSCTDADLKTAAGHALRCLLFDFGVFNVSTIDSFFQLILRTFAREAELTGNYELELDKGNMTSLAVASLLTEIDRPGPGSDPSDPDNARLRNWIEQYLKYNIREGRTFNVFNRTSNTHTSLVRFIRDITNEDFDLNRKQFEAYFSDPDRVGRFISAIGRQLKAMRADVTQRCTAALSACAPLDGTKAVKAAVTTWLDKWRDPAYEPKEPGKTIAANARGEGIFNKKGEETAAAYGTVPDTLTEIISDAANCTLHYSCVSPIYRKIVANSFVLGLLSRVLNIMAQMRAEQSKLLLSDTNVLLHDIIGDDPAPFIYERIGLRLNHYLIDEFQDTSRLQWANLKPLVEESHSVRHDNLIIGDEKQSIYRFRNSDPTLLAELDREFDDDVTVAGASIDDNTNWRSASTVVRFNNTLFRAIASTDPCFAPIYANVAQKVAKANEELTGYVRIRTLSGTDAQTLKADGFRDTLEAIRRQLASGYRPDEIAVLFRKNSEAKEFIDYVITDSLTCESLGLVPVSVASDEALLISRSPAVRIVVSMMRMLSSSDHVTSERNVSMKEIARLLNDFEIAGMTEPDPGRALVMALARRNADTAADTDFDVSVEATTLPALVKRIIALRLTPEQRQKENAHLTAFLDCIVSFSTQGPGDIGSFIEWWDKTGAETATVAAGADTNAVKVLTIHKSKGLEYACVHLPFIDGKPMAADLHWFEPAEMEGIDADDIPPLLPISPVNAMEMTEFAPQYQKIVSDGRLDDLNVLYVAFTRAIRELNVGIVRDPRNCFLSHYIIDGLSNFNKAIADLSATDASLTLGNIAGDSESQVFGEPTTPVRKTEVQGILVPSTTFTMPPLMSTHSNSAAWRDTRLDTETDPLRDAPVGVCACAVVRRVISAADVNREIARMVTIGSFTAAKGAAVAETVRGYLDSSPVTRSWFARDRRVAVNRLVDLGSGYTTRIDRIVTHHDGRVDAVKIIDSADYDPSKEDDYAKSIRRRAYKLHEALEKPVSAWIWCPGSDPQCVYPK